MSFEVSSDEWRAWRSYMDRHWRRFLRNFKFWDPPTVNTQPPHYPSWADRTDHLGHAFVNLFVESGRAGPKGEYITGHFFAFYVLLSVLVHIGQGVAIWTLAGGS